MKRLLPFIFIILSLTPISSLISQIPTNGLIAYYPFNGNANDESGNGNTGTVNGPVLTNDRFDNPNSAFSFDGTNDYIEVNNAASLNNNTTISLVAWFKISNLTSLPDGSYIVSKGINYEYQYNLSITPDNTATAVAWQYDGANHFIAPTTRTIVDNTWHHIVGIIYNNNKTEIYLDGELNGADLTPQGTWVQSGSGKLLIGKFPDNITTTRGHFNGQIDDIRIYNRALTNSEIKSLYHENGYAQVTDIDGNVYETVKIGSQEWMKENLKTIKYNDGTNIPYVTDNISWSALSTPAYCWYNNDQVTYKADYGALYNWNVVNTKKICPIGWHVPSNTDWQTLSDFLGGSTVAGGKLKETGTIHWSSPNTSATNESSFLGLPGGGRDGNGAFGEIYQRGYWWSQDGISSNNGWEWNVFYTDGTLYKADPGGYDGLSIRCIKDDITSGLVAYYPFNGNANDESGNGINGTVSGASLTTDRFENPTNAYSFNGTTSYISVTNSTKLNPPIISISLWTYYQGGTYNPRFLSKTDGTSATYQIYDYLSHSGGIGIGIDGPDVLTGNFIPSNIWTHLVLIRKLDSIKLYINNNKISSIYRSGTLIGNTGPLYFGCNGTSSGLDFMQGKLDDIRIYNRELSESEIKALYNENGYAGVTDIDGNVYQTVTIGTQEWMKENLKTTKLNDGTAIPYIPDNTSWAALTTPGYSWYNFDAATYKIIFGGVYNWHTVNTGKLCPSGWHIPTDPEWTTLKDFLGGENLAGGKLKESGTTFWAAPNTGATNETGFTARPGGYIAYNGGFGYTGLYGYWWTNTESSSTEVWYQYMACDHSAVVKLAGSKNYGFSVRCLRDALAGQTSITSFSPVFGPAGTSVTITGSGFSTTAANNIVWFGAAKATVTASTSTQLTVTVPPGSTYQPISVTVNGLTAYSSKPFIVTFPSAQSVDASSFANKADLITGNTPTFMAIGDIDSDGKPDIAVTNQNSNTISVFRNISTSGLLTTGSFAAKVDFTTAANPVGIDIGDIDGDGKPDIVVTNNGAVSVSVFQNQSTSGSISLATRIDLTTGGNPCGVAVRDFDLDGKNDIAVVNNSGSSVSIIRNISPPGPLTLASFYTKVDFPVGAGPILPAVSDYDGDGKPDIAVTNYTSNNISILRNTSTPGTIDASSFASKVDLITGTGPYAIAAGDIDSDNKTDIVVANYNVNTVSVFRNVSSSGSITTGSFEAKVDFPATRVEFISIGDIDGDSKPDLVVPNYNGAVVAVLKNNSISGTINSSSFAGKVEFTTGTAPWGSGICDLDGDGKPDIVVANGQSTSLSLFRNTIADTPPVPAPVIGIITHPTCTVATGSVALSGLPATGTWTLTRSPGGTTTQGTGTTTTVSGLAAGIYTFTVTNASAVTSPSSSQVTINAQPVTPTAPVVGTITQPTCSVQTGSVQLSGLPSSGTWTLTRSPGNVTTQSSGVSTTISSLPVGTYTYTVTNTSGCTSAASTDVVINVAPGTPSTPTTGTVVQPTCTVTTGSVTINGLPASGNWSLGITPGNISVTGSGTSRTITSLAPGTYTFTVTNDAGCTSLPLSGVVIQAVPTGNVPVIAKKWNSVLVCYNLNNVFTSWQWYRGAEQVSTVTTKAFYNTNKIAGSYRVYATDKDGCKNYSNNIDIAAGSKGVIIYPNPAGDRITLSISDENTGKAVISFYNSSGIKVLEDQTDKPDEVLIREIQVYHLEHGIYTIKITVNQMDISHNRLVISR